MLRITTYKQTYEFNYEFNFECNFATWNHDNNSRLLRFYIGDLNVPWRYSNNTNSLVVVDIYKGIIYEDESLNPLLQGIFIDIMDMIRAEYNKSNKENSEYLVLSHKIFYYQVQKIIRNKKIDSLIK